MPKKSDGITRPAEPSRTARRPAESRKPRALRALEADANRRMIGIINETRRRRAGEFIGVASRHQATGAK